MKSREDAAHAAVLKEFLYWFNKLQSEGLAYENMPYEAQAIVASNLTIASLKFMEE